MLPSSAKNDPQRLRLAIQKSGRMSEGTFAILHRCGLSLSRPKGKLFTRAKDFPLDLLLVRDDDIPGLLMRGACDWGIVGEEVFTEQKLHTQFALEPIEELGFARCKLVLATPQGGKLRHPKELAGKKIATSYPKILGDYLAKQKIQAEIVTLSGAVEAAPSLRIADAICDLVSSGSTLLANGLEEIEEILHSQALLIAPQKPLPEPKRDTAKRLRKRIQGVCMARDAKYIALHTPRENLKAVIALLPGAESPTILPLEDSSYVALHAVCKETIFWDTMEELKKAGARSILVLPIEKILH